MVMVAAFSIQAGLVSPYLPPAHSKPAETTSVSVSETPFASEEPFLCQQSQPWNYAPQHFCHSPLGFIPSFFFPGPEFTSDLKWTLPAALSHVLINGNQATSTLTSWQILQTDSPAGDSPCSRTGCVAALFCREKMQSCQQNPDLKRRCQEIECYGEENEILLASAFAQLLFSRMCWLRKVFLCVVLFQMLLKCKYGLLVQI